jgi:Ubiquitin family
MTATSLPQQPAVHGMPPAPSFKPAAPPYVSSFRPQPSRRVRGLSTNIGGQTIKVTFPKSLQPAPDSVEITEPGLLAKKISDIYEIIDARTGFSPSNSKLTFGGHTLEGDQTLAKYSVSAGDAIMVMPTEPQAPKQA